jgi:hypothetical protein
LIFIMRFCANADVPLQKWQVVPTKEVLVWKREMYYKLWGAIIIIHSLMFWRLNVQNKQLWSSKNMQYLLRLMSKDGNSRNRILYQFCVSVAICVDSKTEWNVSHMQHYGFLSVESSSIEVNIVGTEKWLVF